MLRSSSISGLSFSQYPVHMQSMSCAQVAMKSAIEAEFGKLMAQGGMTANEAALTAVKNVSLQQAGP